MIYNRKLPTNAKQNLALLLEEKIDFRKIILKRVDFRPCHAQIATDDSECPNTTHQYSHNGEERTVWP